MCGWKLRAANQSVQDRNIRVGAQEVAAPTPSVWRSLPGRKGEVRLAAAKRKLRVLHFACVKLAKLICYLKLRQEANQKATERKKGVAHFFGALGPGLLEAESHDAEIFAVEDELRGVELQLLVGAQHLPFPLCIIYWEKQMPITTEPVLFLPEAA